MPLPREPSKGVFAASIKRNAILRRARSSASVKPVGPAPTINICFSYIVRQIIMVLCTNVKTKITVDSRENRHRRTRHRRQGGVRGGLDAPRGARAQSRNDEPLLLREDQRRFDRSDGRRAHG